MISWGGLIAFKVSLTQVGVPIPDTLARGLELIDRMRAHLDTPTRRILTMSDEEALAHMTDLSIRAHTSEQAAATVGGEIQVIGRTHGLQTGLARIERDLLLEIREAMLPELDGIVSGLRRDFEALAEPLVIAARKFDIGYATEPGEMIDRNDSAAIDAYRAAKKAWTALGPIAQFRQSVSIVFGLSPTPAELQKIDPRIMVVDERHIDWSVCYAAGDGWSADRSSYVLRRESSFIDWFRLAAGGGITLNTPTEVREKLRRRYGAELSEPVVVHGSAEVGEPMRYPTRNR